MEFGILWVENHLLRVPKKCPICRFPSGKDKYEHDSQANQKKHTFDLAEMLFKVNGHQNM